MTIAFFCIFIASLLPILWVGVAKVSNGFKLTHNKNPREFLADAQGFSKRANWAQSNAWESLTPFVAAILIAAFVGVNQSIIDIVAVLFIVMRILHGVFYLYNRDLLRSFVWMIGMGCNISLYYFSWVAGKV